MKSKKQLTMKTSINIAASRLGWHPSELIFRMGVLGAEFTNCFPGVDESWLETVTSLKRDTYSIAGSLPSRGGSPQPIPDTLSDPALRILDKLERKKHYGSKCVQMETIRVHLCPGIDNFPAHIAQLMEMDILINNGDRDLVSLNPSKSGLISAILNRYRDAG